MAMPMSTAFTTADRRKRMVTYGKASRLTASQRPNDDASSPERPRKQAAGARGLLAQPGTALSAVGTFGNLRAPRQKTPTPGDIFDVPSDDEPTPRPSAAPIKKPAPRNDTLDVFEVPSSGDERLQTKSKSAKLARPAKLAQPLRKAEPAPRSTSRHRKTSREPERVDARSSKPVPVAPPMVRGRAKTAQMVQKAAGVSYSLPVKGATAKPSSRSRATTPAAPTLASHKSAKLTATVAPKQSVVKPAKGPLQPDMFDIPSSDEEAKAPTPTRTRAAPISRVKAPLAGSISRVPSSSEHSIESDASNASNKRKRRASASSSTTAKGIETSGKTREKIAPQRSRKYQKKEDLLSPGQFTFNQPFVPLAVPNKPEDLLINKPKRTRVRSNVAPPRAHVLKGQSSPAKLHSMLAMRPMPKPLPVTEHSEAVTAEDETMYDIREASTPLARKKLSPIAGSVTPRQQALFNNLLDDSSDSTTPMPSISRLQLTDRPPSKLAALARSSSDIPQSAHTRKSRLLDVLKRDAPSSEENSESDEEAEEKITEISAVSAPAKAVVQRALGSQHEDEVMELDSAAPTSSQASQPQAVVSIQSGARITYAKQRSYLEESNFEDGLLSMDIDDELGLAPNKESLSEDEDDAAQVRGIHELRRQGKHHRFQAEAEAAIDDISAKNGLNSSQRRSAMMEFATQLADRDYVGQLLESALTSSLLQSIRPTGEIIFSFSAAVAVLFILEARPEYAVIEQIYESPILETLKELLASAMSSLDICRIAKDRKTNMSRSARETVAEFRSLVLKSSVWSDEKPEKVSPQLLSVKVLELLAINLRRAGNAEAIVDEGVITHLLDAASGPCRHLKADKAVAQDHLMLNAVFSALESLSVSHDHQATWSNEILSRLADMMPVFFDAVGSTPIRLVIRLCMNLTNNKPRACELFSGAPFVLPLVRSISQNFRLLVSDLDEKRRIEVMEDLILSLGAMINLAEFSDKSRASVIQDGDDLVNELVEIFLEGSERADHVCSRPSLVLIHVLICNRPIPWKNLSQVSLLGT